MKIFHTIPSVPLALSLLVFPVVLQAASDGAKENTRTITVQGQGRVQAVPDMATLSVEVSQEAEDLDPVMTRVRRDMGKVIEAVKAQGIEDKDVQTELFNVRPKWEYDKHANPRRVGYVVTNRVTVKVRDLEKVGKVLTVVTNAGATSVNGPDFNVDNPQTYERKALAQAFEDARSKATALADAAGVHLGQIVSMTPGVINGPVPPRPFMMRAMAMPADAQAQEPVAVGEQTMSATVTVVYSLQ